MSRNHIATYVWIVDTIERYGRLTLQQLNRLWVDSPLSDGNPLPRRTFFNYRAAIEEMFDINLVCDRSTFEYYIEDSRRGGEAEQRMHHWLLDSMSINGMLSDSRAVSGRIILENVPSAREHLPLVVDALKRNVRITFTYKSYTRVLPSKGVVIEPYFVKIFKQLWYVIGRNVKDGRVKTYSLDRMTELHLTDQPFKMPPGFDPFGFFKDCFGIITTHDSAREVVLRVSPTQAKYFRALPLHSSQREEVHDRYSIFHYRMRLTYDLKEEILSHGPEVEVVAPRELRLQVAQDLKKALEQYS